MQKDISPHIISQAARCIFEKQCLEDSEYPLCRVEKVSDTGTTFVCKTSQNDCPYVVGFGFLPVCVCPVRKELYRKYNI